MVDIEAINMEELFNDLRTCLFDLESDLTELSKDNTTKSEVLLRAREVYAGTLDMIDYMKEIQKTVRASYKIKEADVRKYMLEADAGYDEKACVNAARTDNLVNETEPVKDIIADKFASAAAIMATPTVEKKISKKAKAEPVAKDNNVDAPVEKKKISKKVVVKTVKLVPTTANATLTTPSQMDPQQ